MAEGLDIRENVPLAPMTTFGIGGEARYFVDAHTEEALVAALGFAEEKNIGVFILGGGSNILVADSGFDGLVIRIALKGVSIMELPTEMSGDAVLVTARAGEDWDEFVSWCVENDLAGLECLSGIPGSVGGTPIQNVGAYGQEVSESIVSVRVLDRTSLSVVDIPGSECGFSYRSSIFNTSEKGRYIVLSVTYELKRGGRPKVAYRDLEKELGGEEATLADARSAVSRIRKSKGMLVRQGGADSRSAGSFFKNPVVDEESFRRIEDAARELGLINEGSEVPSYPVADGLFKVPAAWLIESSGFPKGFVKGNAGLSTVHTLAITNRGGATASEVLALREAIRARVLEVFGVGLVEEPTFVGFEAGGSSLADGHPV